MTTYKKKKKLVQEFQSGFRAGHSTATALTKVASDIRIAMDKKMTTILILLDFSKAFDSVDHVILFEKLRREFNFDRSAISLIENYLSDRTQSVCIDGVFSPFLLLVKGLPQGTILGPLFINNFPESVKYMMYHLFADDVQIYKSFKQEETIKA